MDKNKKFKSFTELSQFYQSKDLTKNSLMKGKKKMTMTYEITNKIKINDINVKTNPLPFLIWNYVDTTKLNSFKDRIKSDKSYSVSFPPS